MVITRMTTGGGKLSDKDISEMIEIITETTSLFRKGEVVEGTEELASAFKSGNIDAKNLPGGVVSIYLMPHESESVSVEKIDCHFIVVGINKEKAEKNRHRFMELVAKSERLCNGSSYIDVGAEIGDQKFAFSIFAIGTVLGLWDMITPAAFGIVGADADRMAGSGFVMTTGVRR